MKIFKQKYIIVLSFVLGYFILNAIRIYNYSFIYFETKSDVAIVLGAGTKDGELSPIFKERINHSIYLYKKGVVDKIIFTGGIGKGQMQSDSKIAKSYALNMKVHEKDILIEEKSLYTIENIIEAKRIMDSVELETALLVSDPIHMKRSIMLANYYNIKSKSSPTQTTMYKSFIPKMKQLIYETFFFSLREPTSVFYKRNKLE